MSDRWWLRSRAEPQKPPLHCRKVTAGILLEFSVSNDLAFEHGRRLAMRFATPGYYLSTAALVALSGHFHRALAVVSGILVVVGYFTVRQALRRPRP